jgi:hypothetical protein
MFLALRTPSRPVLLAISPPSAQESQEPGEPPPRAARAYRPGDVVFSFDEVEWRPQRDRDTVQHRHGGHIFHPLLARTAHSCDPNCCVSFPTSSMVAIRPIEAGEVISYDYETTETWFSHPFWCQCGSRRCRGRIG